MKEPLPLLARDILIARYEELRAIAVDPRRRASTSSSGYSLLVRHGVAAWTLAWAECAPRSSAPRSDRAPRAALSAANESALVDVLAQMALATRARLETSV